MNDGEATERVMLDRYVAFHREYMTPVRGRVQIWARYARLAAWSRLVSDSLSVVADATDGDQTDQHALACQFARDYAAYRLLARRVADGQFPTMEEA